MRVLLTGASGFLGTGLALALIRRGHEVVAFSADRLLAPVAHAGVAEICGDVCDTAALEDLMRRHRIQILWHGAAITAGAQRESRQAARIMEVNVLATVRLLEAAARSGVRRFIYPSSTAVYGETAFAAPLDEPLAEDAPLRPENLYGITKAAAERAVLRLAPMLGLEACAGRVNAVFGPWERDTGLRDTLSPHRQLAMLAREGREAVLAPGAERDWIYTSDATQAFVSMIEAERVPVQAFNVGAGRLWSLELLARRIPGLRWRYARPGEESNLSYAGPTDRARRALDIRRMREAFGWVPEHTPESACDAYVRWLATTEASAAVGPSVTEAK